MNKKVKMIIIASLLTITSLTLGIVSGVKIASSLDINTNNTEFDRLVNILKSNWYSDIYYGKDCNEDVLIDQFVGALSTSDKTFLDPYTYLTKKEEGQTIVTEKGKIGVTFSNFFNYPVISNIEKDGTAYNKLQIGDIVLKVGKKENDSIKYYSVLDDNINFSNLFDNAIGKKDESLYVSVARLNDTNKFETYDYELTLNERKGNTYASLVDCNISDTTMVSLTSFVDANSYDNTCNQLDAILNENPSKNLIIDLRNNGGGDLSSSINICNLFLPKDTLITTLEFKGNISSKYYTVNPLKYNYENIFILQNEKTASASEVMISALSYYAKNNNGNASYNLYLVGSKSYGKGIAQRNISVLNNTYNLKYTCAKWLRPDNSWIGMTSSYYENNYQLGFEPSLNCNVIKDEILSLMEKYSSKKYVYIKSNNFNAYKYDGVSTLNAYLMDLFNKMYEKEYRNDMYFDNSCVDAIKDFQKLHNIEQNGLMNENTFLYLVNDFYNKKVSFDNDHLKIIQKKLGE